MQFTRCKPHKRTSPRPLRSIGGQILFNVISFAYDDVGQRPELCVTLLRTVLCRYQPCRMPVSRVLLAGKEIIRPAIQLDRPIQPKDVERHFEIDHKTAVLMLKKVMYKRLAAPFFARKW